MYLTPIFYSETKKRRYRKKKPKQLCRRYSNNFRIILIRYFLYNTVRKRTCCDDYFTNFFIFLVKTFGRFSVSPDRASYVWRVLDDVFDNTTAATAAVIRRETYKDTKETKGNEIRERQDGRE